MNFEQFYRTYHGDVHRFALWLGGDPAEADDIASETFVRAWAADAPIRARSIRAYLFTIARNLHRRGFRQRRRRDEHAREPAEHVGNLEEELAGRSELRALLARLQTLAEPDRAALLMRAFHGLSYDEIGAALGTSAAAAKVRVHRTRARLEHFRDEAEPRRLGKCGDQGEEGAAGDSNRSAAAPAQGERHDDRS